MIFFSDCVGDEIIFELGVYNYEYSF
jgi:hypothetical protein